MASKLTFTPLPPPPGGSFVSPNLASHTYESGTWPVEWKNTSINNVPPYNAGNSTGNQIVAARAYAGTYSRQFDYAANAAEVGQTGFGFYNASNGAGPLQLDEIYWLFHVRFDGNSPTTQFKWQRFKFSDADGIDAGGLYYSFGHITWCFGSEASNQNCSLGLHKAAQTSGLNGLGYTAYATNLQNNATYHSIMVHLQRNPNGATTINPRVRFWWDGLPIIQPAGTAYEENGTTTIAATWVDGSGSDPDYGASAPSWLTADTRSGGLKKIRYLEINGAVNAGNTGVGSFNIDNEYLSSVAIDPAL